MAAVPRGAVGSGVGRVAGVGRAPCGAVGSLLRRAPPSVALCDVPGDPVRCGAAAAGWVAWPERGARAEDRLGVAVPEGEGWISQRSEPASQFAGSLENQQ